MNISETYYSVKSNLIFCFAAPIYMMLFAVLYCPTFGYEGDGGWIADWNSHAGFCLPIVCAIVLGVLLASRAILCFALVRHTLSKWEYMVWELAEFVIACLFCDLFLSIHLGTNYFSILPRIMIIGFGLLVMPYLCFWLAMEIASRDQRLREADETIRELRKGAERSEAGAIRFVDEKGSVKLAVGADKVISIESAGNYVTILYDNGGRLLRYSLRNTLKSLEAVCKSNGLVRCHRSYFVNIKMIKIIRRTADGLFAEIDHAGVEDIPISKSYATELMQLFSDN